MRRVTCACGILCMLAALSGCQTPLRAPSQSGNTVTFKLLDRNLETLQFALYILDVEETLSGSGGLDARNDKVAWSMALDAADIAQLLAAIHSAGWLNGDAIGEPEDASGARALAVAVRGPDGSKAFTIEAMEVTFGPQTTAVLKILRDFSNRRFQQNLNELPQSGDSLGGR